MPDDKNLRRCRVCGGQVAPGALCPRCRTQATDSKKMSHSAWIMIGSAVFLLAALYLWASRIESDINQPLSKGRAAALVPDGELKPGRPVPLAFGQEECRPWNISAAQKPPAPGVSFVFITSRTVDPYGLFLSGFSSECQGPLRSMWLEDLAPGALAGELAKTGPGSKTPSAVAAIGPAAARRVRYELPGMPMLFAEVSDPLAAGLDGARSAGVSPWVPARPLARHMLATLPKKAAIGILHSPGRSAGLARRVAAAIADKGRQAVLYELESAEAAKTVLPKAASTKAWIVLVDRRVIGENLFNQILVAAEKRHIPVGVSDEEYVRRGALVGVGADSYRIGRQLCRLAGAMARKQLPAGSHVFCPEYSFAAINTTVAEKLGYMYDFRDVKQIKVYKWH